MNKYLLNFARLIAIILFLVGLAGLDLNEGIYQNKYPFVALLLSLIFLISDYTTKK